MIATIGTPYVYTPCPACDQQIRFTCGRDEAGTPTLDIETTKRGVRLHIRYACEAVQR